jgi:uncharacterized membrane protein HdeD (DUF308 family)
MYQKQKLYRWGLPTGLGLVLTLFGVIAIAVPLLATLEISWLLAVLFVVSGIIQLIHTFRFDPMRSRVGRFLLAALSIVAGVLILGNPISGAFAITLVMAFYFLVASVGRAALAFELRKSTRSKGWMIASSIISLFFGIYLIATLSTSSLVIPGLFLGVDLIFYGVTLVTLGVGLKKEGVIVELEWPKKSA